MKVVPLAADSLGVRSVATYVECGETRILIDPGAALGAARFGLPPADAEWEALRRANDRISAYAERAGWIFVSSPNAVTPFHMDHEHNFILQIRGTKRLYVWEPFDRVVVSERAQELFHDAHSRELVTWNEEWRSRAHVFDLQPGQGGYMPSTAPHLVEVGPEPSVTISFTYYTDSTRQRELLYRGNARLRRLGITPTPVGDSPQRDRMKAAVLAGYTVARNSARRLLGRSIRQNDQTYAPA